MTPAILRAQRAHTARTDRRFTFRLTQCVLSIPGTSTCMNDAFGVSRALGRQTAQHTANAVWE
jgi:hypothetical protein